MRNNILQETKGGIPKRIPSGMRTKQKYRLIFYCLVIALPLLQFCVFYVGVNLNSILLAFSTYDGKGGTNYFAAGFGNFAEAFRMLGNFDSGRVLSNSVLATLCEILISLPLALIFSFYIYKKFPCHKLFKVVLFLPQLVSITVFSSIFMYLTESVCKLLEIDPLLEHSDRVVRLVSVLFFNIWISFGVNIIMFTGSMSSIDPSLTEASQLDGASVLQEFWYVALPLIWSTFTTFLVVSLTGLFVNQLNLYSLYSSRAGTENSTFGYLLFIAGQGAGLDKAFADNGFQLNLDYYGLSALGLTFTCITVPIALGARKLLRAFGPSVE